MMRPVIVFLFSAGRAIAQPEDDQHRAANRPGPRSLHVSLQE